ncbi:MAG: hypothetical protein ACO1RX_21405 [Candidatus Sericytochromatia bacterium]
MRIESNTSSGSVSPLRVETSAADAPEFWQILSQTLEPAPPRPAGALPLMLSPAELRSPRLEQQALRQELRQEETELLEQRQDELIEDLDENREAMQELVEDWIEAADSRSEMTQESGQESLEGLQEGTLEGLEDLGDDLAEILSDFDEIPLDPGEHESGASSEGGSGGAGGGSGQANSEVRSSSGERPLSYQEIQNLVETVLLGPRHLPGRVRQLLQKLLESLLDGQRWLLTHERLIGLDHDEWQLLMTLFPPHFYGGLLRQTQSQQHAMPLYTLLQDLYEQNPPDQDRQEVLLQLWSPSFANNPPLLLRNWLLGQPLLFQPEELSHLLEIWQQQHTLPPGAIGRTLQLALVYQHHPELQARLFALAGDYLYRRDLRPEQIQEIAQRIFERCYPLDMADQALTVGVLERTLQGEELKPEELGVLVQGCSQSVLSYLPYAYVHPQLQEIMDYTRRDLLGQEDQIPQLLEN